MYMTENRQPITSYSLKKNWIFPGYQLSYRSTLSIDTTALTNVAANLLREIYPQLVNPTTGAVIRNFKGRTPNDRILTHLPPCTEHELALCTGLIAKPVEEDEDEAQGEQENQEKEIDWEPFTAFAHTKFKEFVGNNDIDYSLLLQLSKYFDQTIPYRAIPEAPTIQLKQFRFGIEHFQPTLGRLFYGYTPAVEETFIIDADENTLAFELRVDGSTREITNPLLSVPLFKEMLATLSSTLEIDYLGEFQRNWGV